MAPSPNVTLVVLAIAAIAVAIGLWILVRQSRRKQGSAPLVLAAFPLALLLLVTPIPLGALWVIGVFQTTGRGGATPPALPAHLVNGLADPLWWGMAGCLATLIVAALLQRAETQRITQAMIEAPQEDPAPAPAWTSSCIAASVLLAVPAAVLLTLQSNSATLLMNAAVDLRVPGPREVAGMPLLEFSQTISSRLIVSMVGGFALVAAVLVWSLGNIAAHRFSTHSEGLQMLSQGVLIVMTLFGLWTLFTLSSNATTFARVMP